MRRLLLHAADAGGRIGFVARRCTSDDLGVAGLLINQPRVMTATTPI